MSMGKVSVVIPTYNRAYCLPATLQSLQRQTYSNWEAVVVDDGSTDDTAALIERLRAQDPRIKYLSQRNAGVSAARNAGLRSAEGDWIGFLDSDDAWEPWKLAAQVACFEQLPDVGMVWTDMNAVDDHGTLVSSRYLRKMYSAYSRFGDRPMFAGERAFSEFAPSVAQQDASLATATVRWGDLYSAMIFGSLVHTSTALLSRKRLLAVGFFNETFRTGEDYDFHLRTCREGPVALLDAPSVRYRIAGGADQLTAPACLLEVARNGLKTREVALARDRSRIALSDAEIATIMADASSWVAAEFFKAGDFAAARPYYWRSLAQAWRKPKVLAKASLTLLPPSWVRTALKLYSGH
jgi:GT2 family glycosyltransferase